MLAVDVTAEAPCAWHRPRAWNRPRGHPRGARDVAHLASAANPHHVELERRATSRGAASAGRRSGSRPGHRWPRRRRVVGRALVRRLRRPTRCRRRGAACAPGAAAQVAEEELLRLDDRLEPALGLFRVFPLVLVRVEDQSEAPEGTFHILARAVRRQPEHEARGDLSRQTLRHVSSRGAPRPPPSPNLRRRRPSTAARGERRRPAAATSPRFAGAAPLRGAADAGRAAPVRRCLRGWRSTMTDSSSTRIPTTQSHPTTSRSITAPPQTSSMQL